MEIQVMTEKNDTSRLTEKYIFRNIRQEEIAQTSEIEKICFPPNEACSARSMTCRWPLERRRRHEADGKSRAAARGAEIRHGGGSGGDCAGIQCHPAQLVLHAEKLHQHHPPDLPAGGHLAGRDDGHERGRI